MYYEQGGIKLLNHNHLLIKVLDFYLQTPEFS